jgi:uncharacterized delta-60 repeat protein
MKSPFLFAVRRFSHLALLPLCILVLLVGGAGAVRGQSALDGFDQNANGAIQAIVVQPDGKILIGGAFTTLTNNGVAVTRNRIARLNPDGTLDTAFNPNVAGGSFPVVYAIALQADGKILAGGDFTTVGGQTRNRIARLDAITGAPDSFDPNANNTVRAIAVQADGKILAGGFFSGVNSIGGQTRTNLARLDATSGAADAFNPNPNGGVLAIALQSDGKILVGGAFTSIGGQTRTNLARLDATSGTADAFSPNPNSLVFAIAFQADGKIVAGGIFTSIGGQTRNNIARLDATSGAVDAFNPNANNAVLAITVQPDGKILAGGDFSGANSIGGATRNRTARLDATTGQADSFDPNANNTVSALAIQADGKVLVGGFFTTLAPNGGAAVTPNRIARLERDGRVDRTLDPGVVGTWYAMAFQPDGKILIGGLFSSIAGTGRTNIARLNTDGTLDTTFNPNANGQVICIVVQADGKILVGGDFTVIGGQGRHNIARLDGTTGLADSFEPDANDVVLTVAVQPDGRILAGGFFSGFNSIGGKLRNGIARLDPTNGLADSFDPNANNALGTLALQPDGKILAGGSFSSIGGQTRNRVARLDGTTGLADSFDPNANTNVGSSVLEIALQMDGKVLVGGIFTNIGGLPRTNIARLDPTTGLADSFDPNANNGPFTIVAQADGKIVVGGAFVGIGGQTRGGLARLDGTTGLADSFNPNPNAFSPFLFSTAVQADGKILTSGNFANIGGQARDQFARLSNDTAALQSLAVSQNSITWTLGGSSPQFTRVSFESSTNNVNYTLLGSGTTAGSSWILTGVNFPATQNIYIRARGFYRGGYHNSSESIMESVRNAFFAARPFLNIQPSANTNIVLSWLTNFIGFTLEANTNLTTNVWNTVSPMPSVVGTNNVVTNAASGEQKYYRLSKP